MATAKEQLKGHGIALTGGIGTGKSTVARLIAMSGVPVIDADRLARAVVAPRTDGLEAIVKVFGAGVLAEDGSLDRKALGALVFGDPAKRKTLETITHPRIRSALYDHMEALGLVQVPVPFVYEASLIFETGTEDDYREVWATYCPPDTQAARLMARDGIDRARADQIIAAQLSAKDKAARAALVIDTSGSLDDVAAQVRKALLSL